MAPRYIVQLGFPNSTEAADTPHLLISYLQGDPHPDYRLVSAIKNAVGRYELIWELLP